MKFICIYCCWYDNDNGKCLKSPDYNDRDTGKVGCVTDCSGFVRIDT